VRAEREYSLGPLALPDPDALPPVDELPEYAAVALFLARAQTTKNDFALTEANAAAIAAICARLDDLPLAIELAAARIKLLPPKALLAQLASRLDMLSGGARDMDERQQAMRNTLAWSENLLTVEERTLFRRLAVFVGGCTLEAALAVCVTPDGAEPLHTHVLDGLSALVDHNLMQVREESDETRFGMLQVIREYALEQLVASGEAEALRQAHAGYFLALAEQDGMNMSESEAEHWRDSLELEHDNLRAALGWARTKAQLSGETRAVEFGLRLAMSLVDFWRMRNHLREGRPWIEEMLALAGASGMSNEAGNARSATSSGRLVADDLWARSLHSMGKFVLRQGDYAAAQTYLEQSLPLLRAIGDNMTAASALNGLGNIAYGQDDLEQSRAYWEEALTLYRELGEPRGIGVLLMNLGSIAYLQGDLAHAETATQEALTLLRQSDFRRGVVLCLVSLGDIARLRGELAQAQLLGQEALTLSHELGNLHRCAESLECLARTAGTAGQGKRAARLLGAATALRETMGSPMPPPEQAVMEQIVAQERAELGEAAWAQALAAGKAITLEEAIAEALRDGELPS